MFIDSYKHELGYNDRKKHCTPVDLEEEILADTRWRSSIIYNIIQNHAVAYIHFFLTIGVQPEYFSYIQNDCYDLEGFCPYWQSVGECQRDGQEKFMHTNCPYSCGVCQRESVGPTEQNAPYENIIHPVTCMYTKLLMSSWILWQFATPMLILL